MPTLAEVREGDTVTLKDGTEAQVLLIERGSLGNIREVRLRAPGGPLLAVEGKPGDEIASWSRRWTTTRGDN